MSAGMKERIASLLFALGVKPGVSTGIHGGLTVGYGKLDSNGFWQYEVINPRCRSRFGRRRCEREYLHDARHGILTDEGVVLSWGKTFLDERTDWHADRGAYNDATARAMAEEDLESKRRTGNYVAR